MIIVFLSENAFKTHKECERIKNCNFITIFVIMYKTMTRTSGITYGTRFEIISSIRYDACIHPILQVSLHKSVVQVDQYVKITQTLFLCLTFASFSDPQIVTCI